VANAKLRLPTPEGTCPLQAQPVLPRAFSQLSHGNRLVEELGRSAVEDGANIREKYQSLCGSDRAESRHFSGKIAAHVKHVGQPKDVEMMLMVLSFDFTHGEVD
jgi:hypothetical protein